MSLNIFYKDCNIEYVSDERNLVVSDIPKFITYCKQTNNEQKYRCDYHSGRYFTYDVLYYECISCCRLYIKLLEALKNINISLDSMSKSMLLGKHPEHICEPINMIQLLDAIAYWTKILGISSPIHLSADEKEIIMQRLFCNRTKSAAKCAT